MLTNAPQLLLKTLLYLDIISFALTCLRKIVVLQFMLNENLTHQLFCLSLNTRKGLCGPYCGNHKCLKHFLSCLLRLQLNFTGRRLGTGQNAASD